MASRSSGTPGAISSSPSPPPATVPSLPTSAATATPTPRLPLPPTPPSTSSEISSLSSISSPLIRSSLLDTIGELLLLGTSVCCGPIGSRRWSIIFFFYTPRNPRVKPTERLRAALGDDFYICRFQEPGDIEEEFASIDTTRIVKQFFASKDPLPPCIPKGTFARSAEKAITLPPWLSEDDINYFADKFKQKGFTGGLNYYRALDLTWELMAPWTGSQISVPVKFMVGDQDISYSSSVTKDYIHKGGFKKDVPLLEDVVIMEGVAHFINQEKPEEVSKHIQQFFDKF